MGWIESRRLTDRESHTSHTVGSFLLILQHYVAVGVWSVGISDNLGIGGIGMYAWWRAQNVCCLTSGQRHAYAHYHTVPGLHHCTVQLLAKFRVEKLVLWSSLDEHVLSDIREKNCRPKLWPTSIIIYLHNIVDLHIYGVALYFCSALFYSSPRLCLLPPVLRQRFVEFTSARQLRIPHSARERLFRCISQAASEGALWAEQALCLPIFAELQHDQLDNGKDKGRSPFDCLRNKLAAISQSPAFNVGMAWCEVSCPPSPPRHTIDGLAQSPSNNMNDFSLDASNAKHEPLATDSMGQENGSDVVMEIPPTQVGSAQRHTTSTSKLQPQKRRSSIERPEVEGELLTEQEDRECDV